LALSLNASTAEASLADALGQLSVAQSTVVAPNGVTLVQAGARGPDVLTPEIQNLALRGIDFPLPPTTPGFVYTYDPSSGVFVQSKSLGPSFTERALTVGEGRFDIGGSFLWGNLDSVNGGGFGTSQSFALTTLTTTDNKAVFLDTFTTIKDFSLRSS